MKRSLGHLPPPRAQLLREIRDVIRETAEDKFAMLILFGSHARGNWVDDQHEEGQATHVYHSDFDLLLIVNSPKDAHGSRCLELESKIKKALRREGINGRYAPSAHVIIHDIADVNKQLRRGRYFFSDIKREGVLLATSGEHKLERRRKLNPKERQGQAKADFKQWHKSAGSFLIDSGNALKRRDHKIAAFHLHQATERFYSAVLLVFSSYKPRSHDIEELGKLAASQDTAFLSVFPRATDEEDRLFKLLRSAYVEARYDPGYRITRKELEQLGKHVRKLQRLTKRLCEERIASFVQPTVD